MFAFKILFHIASHIVDARAYPQAVWKTGDGAKYSGSEDEANLDTTSAIVSDGVVDLSTGKIDRFQDEVGVFQFCNLIETVTLPKSLRKIGGSAFLEVIALRHVDIPSGVNEIGDKAFADCHSLRTVTIPDGVVHLPHGIFDGCECLETVKLPVALKTIGDNAFNYCESLTMINFGDLKGVTEIGSWAFASCVKLNNVKLPPLLKTIEEFTFYGCESLSKVELPASLENITKVAFDHCHRDLLIELPDTLRRVDMKALRGCRIRLPTTLTMMLTKSKCLLGLLNKVHEVVISSHVSLGMLVDYINGLPKMRYYNPLEDEHYFDDDIPDKRHRPKPHHYLGFDEFELAMIEDHNLDPSQMNYPDDDDGKVRPFLDPDLKFKVLYGGPATLASSLPPLKASEHVPESFFSFSISPRDVKSLYKSDGDGALHSLVESAFIHKLSPYAEVLNCKATALPAEG